jgi:hypothetical protein
VKSLVDDSEAFYNLFFEVLLAIFQHIKGNEAGRLQSVQLELLVCMTWAAADFYNVSMNSRICGTNNHQCDRLRWNPVSTWLKIKDFAFHTELHLFPFADGH